MNNIVYVDYHIHVDNLQLIGTIATYTIILVQFNVRKYSRVTTEQ